MTTQPKTDAGPPRATASFHQILILLAASLFGGGGAAVELADRLPDVVEDKTRRATAVSIAEEIGDMVRSYEASAAELRNSLLDTVSRYEATRGDLESVMQESLTAVQDLETRLLDARFRLREVLTADEWHTLWEDYSLQ